MYSYHVHNKSLYMKTDEYESITYLISLSTKPCYPRFAICILPNQSQEFRKLSSLDQILLNMIMRSDTWSSPRDLLCENWNLTHVVLAETSLTCCPRTVGWWTGTRRHTPGMLSCGTIINTYMPGFYTLVELYQREGGTCEFERCHVLWFTN